MPHTSHTLQLPLHGVRVVEFEGIGPGPLAARMLVDMGAEVIEAGTGRAGCWGAAAGRDGGEPAAPR